MARPVALPSKIRPKEKRICLIENIHGHRPANGATNVYRSIENKILNIVRIGREGKTAFGFFCCPLTDPFIAFLRRNATFINREYFVCFYIAFVYVVAQQTKRSLEAMLAEAVKLCHIGRAPGRAYVRFESAIGRHTADVAK